MFRISKLIVLLGWSALPMSAHASAVDELLQQYRAQGAGSPDVRAAEAQWTRPVVDPATGQKRHCSLCHTTDLRAAGKHATTGKAIEPLAPSANPKRLTDAAHIEKWLLRNCKWTLGRECTPGEKGNFLVFIGSK
jgi:hypothetical protein